MYQGYEEQTNAVVVPEILWTRFVIWVYYKSSMTARQAGTSFYFRIFWYIEITKVTELGQGIPTVLVLSSYLSDRRSYGQVQMTLLVPEWIGRGRVETGTSLILGHNFLNVRVMKSKQTPL